MYKSIKILKENGILSFGSFLIGFPSETISDVFKTIEGLTKEEFSIFVEKNKEDFGEGQDIISITIAPEDFAKEKDKDR